MNLSYLDVLLGTTLVFVIIYGVSSRAKALPEIEGTSIVARVTAIPAQGTSTASVTFHVQYKVPNADNVEVEVTSHRHDLTETLYIDGRDRSAGLLRVVGQPDPGCEIVVLATRTVPNIAIAQLLCDRRQKIADRLRALPDFGDVDEWARAGEFLVLQRPGLTPEAFKQQRRDWLRKGKYSPEQLKAKFLSEHTTYYGVVNASVHTRALIVHAAVSGDLTNLDALSSDANFNSAIQRVERHLRGKYGGLAPYLLASTSGRIRGTKISLQPTTDLLLDGNATQDQVANTLYSQSGGPWGIEDVFSAQLGPPSQCHWSYGGQIECDVQDWELQSNLLMAKHVINVPH